MVKLAIKILQADKSKFNGLVLGVAFSVLLMSQQVSIFVGIMKRTASQITDINESQLWVVDKTTRYSDEIPTISDSILYKIKSIPHVKWAVRHYKSQSLIKYEHGSRAVVLIGVDDVSLVGLPCKIILGNKRDLLKPNSVIIDVAGYSYLWSGPPKLGGTIIINDIKHTIVAISDSSPPFTTLPIIYTTFSNIKSSMPNVRNYTNAILINTDEPEIVQRSINNQFSHLLCFTNKEFEALTILYFLKYTGIPINFGITIALGFIIGLIITWQTYYLFVIDNLKQFATLRAMGAKPFDILTILFVQNVYVVLLGSMVGIGMSSIFFEYTSGFNHLKGLKLENLSLIVTVVALFVIIITSVATAFLKIISSDIHTTISK